MGLRTKLVFAFMAVSVFVLILFGTLTHRIALDAAAKKERALFLDFARQEADELSSRIGGDYSRERLRDVIQPYESKHRAFNIAHEDGTIIYTSPAFKALDGYPTFPRIGLVNKQETSGMVGEGQRSFLWASAVLPGSPYRLTVIQHVGNEIDSFFGALAGRLIGVGIIIVWLAIWCALILSTVISKRLEKQNAKIIYQAFHDSLTDLPNRNLLNDRIEQAIRAARRENGSVTLLMLDLDRFKEINDTLGHRFGDQLLKAVGPRLRKVVRASDTVARLGGDEFAVLLPIAGSGTAARCTDKILAAFKSPFTINGMELEMQASIGVAIFPDHGEDAETLMRRTEVAMYQAKQNKCEFVFYSHDEDPHSLRRLSLMTELRHAIETNELVLHYQPKVNLSSRKTVGVEALLRWQHRELGFIPPDEFIPLAEQSGLIRPLTQWVLNTALRQSHTWREAGIDLTMAVNLSTHDLLDVQLAERVDQLLDAWDMVPTRLELEITESAMMVDPDRAKGVLQQLDALGVRLAIDDFGTGHSSLAYLKELPVDDIKIDKSFVMDMVRDKNNEVIVRYTMDLAHNFGCRVVAEGVESEDILALLETYGCDTAQGYYMSRPLPAEKLVKWLETSPWGVEKREARKDNPPGTPTLVARKKSKA